MIFLPILIFGAGIVTCVYSNAIAAEGYAEQTCPPADNIAPCTCFKAPYNKRLTASCGNLTDANEIKAIFDKNPDWKLQDVWVENSVLPYLPALMFEKARFEIMNVTSTTMVTLFDKPPVSTPKLILCLNKVKLQRGLEWKSLSKINLLTLQFRNMRIKSFGREFKENIPKTVQNLWFQDTGVVSIKDQAFAELTKLDVLIIKGGNLKKVSRDMFPKPSPIFVLDLSGHKIADLPEDFFTDSPELSYFFFQDNLMHTISEKTFTIHNAQYAFKGNPIVCNCNIKWITEKLNLKEVLGFCAEPASLKGTKLGDLTAESFAYCQ